MTFTFYEDLERDSLRAERAVGGTWPGVKAKGIQSAVCPGPCFAPLTQTVADTMSLS